MKWDNQTRKKTEAETEKEKESLNIWLIPYRSSQQLIAAIVQPEKSHPEIIKKGKKRPQLKKLVGVMLKVH